MVTPGLLEALGGDRDIAMRRLANEVLARFLRHDWGRVDSEDRAANDADLTTGGRVLAAYEILGADARTKLRVWVVHYPRIAGGDDRREPETTICLPSEY